MTRITSLAAVLFFSMASAPALAHGGNPVLPPAKKSTSAETQRTACLFCCNNSCNSGGGKFVFSLPAANDASQEPAIVAGRGWSGFQGRIIIR